MFKEMHELDVRYDARASFYGKARVLIDENDDEILQSYGTQVAKIYWKNGKRNAEVYGTYSTTTLRHIKEFLLQNGFRADNKTQIVKDYLKGEDFTY